MSTAVWRARAPIGAERPAAPSAETTGAGPENPVVQRISSHPILTCRATGHVLADKLPTKMVATGAMRGDGIARRGALSDTKLA